MRSHDQIITDAGGPSALSRRVTATAGAIKQWRRSGSIPAPYWQGLADAGLATLEELAAAVARPMVGAGHAANLAPSAEEGAENPARNVSRTDEPGSSASAPALTHTAAAHQVAEADAVKGAAGDDAVIGSATRHAGHAPTHGDVDERLPSGTAAGGVEFGRVEVSQANLDPTRPALPAQGLNAEAVAVADVDNRAGEGAARAQFERHGPAIRNSRAGIGGGRPGEREEEDGQGGKSKHSATLKGEGYRRVSA